MKLQLKDSKKTVITSFDTEIKYYHTHEEGRQGYLGILEINGMTLRYEEKTYATDVKKDFQKLINKGARKVYEPAYISEQEQGYIDGMATDAKNPTLHGRELYSILAGENSGRFVRDYFRQTSCEEKDLIIPSWELRYPEYKHDCEECIYLGFYEGADLYYCNQPHNMVKTPTLIARYSNDSWDYLSGIHFASSNKFINEAKKRAIEVGILENDEPQQ